MTAETIASPDVEHIVGMGARNAAAATALASWPDKVRGYGGVRERNAQTVAGERESLRDQVLREHASAA